MSKLFTVFLNFQDRVVGIGQFESDSPINVLSSFIKKSESLNEYDRDYLLSLVKPECFTQLKSDRGVWLFNFSAPDYFSRKWPNNNMVYGGYIVQTDPESETR